MQVCVIGYMMSGKSTIGPLLAHKLSLPFEDLDEMISKEAQMSVQDLLRKKGELAFRKLERTELLKALGKENVLSLGGGTPCYYDNIDVLLKQSFVVYLQWSMKTLVNRLLEERASRPLLDGVSDEDLYEYVAKHVFDRRPFYEKAHHIVFCDGKSKEDICNEIIEAWKKRT